MKKITEKEGVYLFTIVLVFYYCICFVRRFFSATPNFYNYLIVGVEYALLLFFCLSCLCLKYDTITIFLGLFIITTLVPTIFLNRNLGLFSQIARIGDMFLWIGLFYFSRKYGNERFIPLFLIMAIIHFIIYIPLHQYNQKNFTSSISCAYFSLFLLPIALTVKKYIGKIFFSIICLIPVLLSEKRTGFLVAIIGILVYLYLELKSSKQNKLERFLRWVITLVGIIIMAFFIIDILDVHIFERLEKIKEDEGSGRIEVWNVTWKMICESSAIEIFIGHGYNAVLEESPLILSAHSDFLEVLYDFGIIGFIAYFGFIYMLTKRAIRDYKNNGVYASVFLTSIVMVLVFSFSSHLVVYPSYFLYVCMYWGLFIGFEERKYKKESNYAKINFTYNSRI